MSGKVLNSSRINYTAPEKALKYCLSPTLDKPISTYRPMFCLHPSLYGEEAKRYHFTTLLKWVSDNNEQEE